MIDDCGSLNNFNISEHIHNLYRAFNKTHPDVRLGFDSCNSGLLSMNNTIKAIDHGCTLINSSISGMMNINSVDLLSHMGNRSGEMDRDDYIKRITPIVEYYDRHVENKQTHSQNKLIYNHPYYSISRTLSIHPDYSTELLRNVDISASDDMILLQSIHHSDHRSQYNDSLIEKIVYRSKRPEDKILFVLGNGPSLKEVMDDPAKLEILRKYTTFGMNNAYKMYEKYNFYPTYFGSFDFNCNEVNRSAFEEMILSDNGIEKYFLVGSKRQGQNMYSEAVRSSEKFQKLNFIRGNRSRSTPCDSFSKFMDLGFTGPNCVRAGMIMGYKKIILLGCDCNYKKHKSNDNYWFDGYYDGSKRVLPQHQKQNVSWGILAKSILKDVTIINCSPITTISCFIKNSFDDAHKAYV